MAFDRDRRDHDGQRSSEHDAEPAVGKENGVGFGEMLAGMQGSKSAGNPDAAAQSGSREGGRGETARNPAAGGPPGAGGAAGALGKITVAGKSKAAGEPISKVALGEKVTFTAPEEGTWTIEGVEVATGRSIEWKAPGTPGGRIVRFDPFLDSPNKGKSTSTIVLVAAPTGLEFKKLMNVPSARAGMAGVGMFLEVTVSPTDVSFEDFEWLERPGPALNPSGYFAAYIASGESLDHPPNPNWLPMGADNKGIVDRAFSRDKPKLKKPDEPDKPDRWWAGSFSWDIPNVYRVKGFPGEHLFANVTQTFTMDDQGAMTVTKGAASATAKPGGDVEGDFPRFTDIKEAETYLTRFNRGGAVQAAMWYRQSPKADEASVALLTQALVKFDILLRVELKCQNKFSITDPDVVTLKANKIASEAGSRKFEDPKKDDDKTPANKMAPNEGSFEFHLNQVLDLKGLAPAPINLSANMESMISHETTVVIPFPYAKAEGAMHGNRYTYVAFIK